MKHPLYIKCDAALDHGNMNSERIFFGAKMAVRTRKLTLRWDEIHY